MKTILLSLSLLISIASGLYGQENLATNSLDSISISVQEFFAIERMRRNQWLLKSQYSELEKAYHNRNSIINAQQVQLNQYLKKEELNEKYITRLEFQYKKEKLKGKLAKMVIPIALVGGFLLGSR